MIDATLMAAILDSLKDPLLFADTEHTIRYMNRAAIAHYDEGQSLIGRSLLDCHNEQSQQKIIEILATMQAGRRSDSSPTMKTTGFTCGRCAVQMAWFWAIMNDMSRRRSNDPRNRRGWPGACLRVARRLCRRRDRQLKL